MIRSCITIEPSFLLLFTMRLSMFFADNNLIFPVAVGNYRLYNHCGDNSLKDPPVLIPNTEVKLLSAEGTWSDTTWETKTLPHPTKKAGLNGFQICFFICQKKPLVKRLFLLFGYFDCFLQIGFEVVGDFAVALDLNKRKTHVHKVFVPVAEQKCGVCQAPLW